jgi:hypothetical protein
LTLTKERRKGQVCLNCAEPLLAHENFCPNCGQENHSRQASVLMLIDDFLKDYLTFDSKFFSSVIPLFLRPGKMTLEYTEGKRVKYIPPIRLFLFLSFIYFGLSFLFGNPFAGEVVINGESNMSQSEFSEAFSNNFNIVIFLFTPIQAAVLMLLFRSKEKFYYVNYFVYTLHLFSFFFLLGSMMILILEVFERIISIAVLDVIHLFMIGAALIYIVIYSIVSLRVVFQKGLVFLRYLVTVLISIVLFILVLYVFATILSILFGIS